MRAIIAGIFLVSLATLMLELLLLRVFEVILFPTTAYMVITCAMFCFGLAGVYVTLKPLPPEKNIRKTLSQISLGMSVAIILLLPVMNFLPFDFFKFPDDPWTQTLAFSGMYFFLALPFFFSGLIFARIFSQYAANIQSLYFWDLVGAAIGCVIFIPFLPEIGPGGLMFCASACILIASGLFSENKRWFKVTLIFAVFMVAVPFFNNDEYYDFILHQNKREVKTAKENNRIELTRWDPVAKIDVVSLRNKKHIAYDGGSQSSMFYPLNIELDTLRNKMPAVLRSHFSHYGVVASHFLKRDSEQEVLIVGSAGGQEIKAAVMHNAAKVDAIEMVEAVVNLGKEKYSEYIGHLFKHPNVSVKVDEGRSFLRSSRNQYDIIQIFSNHTSSSMASGSIAMATVYLQTAEAYQEYFQSLKNDGILHLNHHYYPRLISTAAKAWVQSGRGNFRQHVLVLSDILSLEDVTGENIWWDDPLYTILIKMSPWQQNEVAELATYFSTYNFGGKRVNVLENPLSTSESFLPETIFSGQINEAAQEELLYNISPSTDNKPFFNFVRKNIDFQAILEFNIPAIRDILHLIGTGLFAILISGMFVLLPLIFYRSGPKSQWKHRKLSLVYFSCLGAGFIILELIFIQMLMKLIGYPLYTYSTIVFVILFSAGVGSYFSGKWQLHQTRHSHWIFAAIIFTGFLLNIFHQDITEIFLASPVYIRILSAIIMVAPFGFFLGMPFPLGILQIEQQSDSKTAIAWAWGMNGLFTVIGGYLSIILTLAYGFQTTFFIALGIYAIAWLIFFRINTERNPLKASLQGKH